MVPERHTPAQSRVACSHRASVLMVSERHIQGYKETMTNYYQGAYTGGGAEGFDVACFGPTITSEVGDFRPIQTVQGVLSRVECQMIIDEAEALASVSGWSTKRHGSYPTTDLPLPSLPNSLAMFNAKLEQTILPLMGAHFSQAIPGSMTSLRVADAFVVKYNAAGGQTELKPHRDGSVLSFNIALNMASEFEGGGTWFASTDSSLRLEQGEMLMHASGCLHAGSPITSGTRFILVGFVILVDYQNVAMRFMKTVWDK
mmetsp:Transcript_31611/g.78248  ORF Transcript_31611/g.78248 Transcript_31611/m.78248 type:complete len:258 (+) Transcript_31611:155-928(+)